MAADLLIANHVGVPRAIAMDDRIQPHRNPVVELAMGEQEDRAMQRAPADQRTSLRLLRVTTAGRAAGSIRGAQGGRIMRAVPKTAAARCQAGDKSFAIREVKLCGPTRAAKLHASKPTGTEAGELP